MPGTIVRGAEKLKLSRRNPLASWDGEHSPEKNASEISVRGRCTYLSRERYESLHISYTKVHIFLVPIMTIFSYFVPV